MLVLGGDSSGTQFMYPNLSIKNIGCQYQRCISLISIPVLDTLRVMLVRLLNRKSPFSADTNHLHHILFKNYGTKKTLIIYGLIFISTNVMSYLNIVSSIFIISNLNITLRAAE